MSRYTTEVRFICESYLHNKGIDIKKLTVDEIINQSHSMLFNFTYPIYDEKYRPVLEHNVIRHFYTKEIAYETVERWKLGLNDRLNLIMPRYNKLYESALLEFDPFDNNSLHETSVRETTGNTQSNATSESTRKGTGTNKTTTNSLYSDTPQGVLSNKDYATSLNEDTMNGSTNNTETGNGTSQEKQTMNNLDKFILDRTGTTGNKSEMLMKYRETFLNIDDMICNELNDLFFNLWW